VLLARDIRDLAAGGAGLARAVRLEEALAVGARDPHVVLVLVFVFVLVLHRAKVRERLELVFEDNLVLTGRVLVLVPEAVVLVLVLGLSLGGGALLGNGRDGQHAKKKSSVLHLDLD
jgi:hypothetical protein